MLRCLQVRLFHRAVVVANNQSGSMRGIVLQLGIDQFENEGRRVAAGSPITNTPQKFSVQDPTARGSLFSMGGQELSIHRRVIQELLRPHDWYPPEDRSNFFLHGKELNELCGMVENVLQTEPTVLKLKAPIKIFGDLHGQFTDLMRLFQEYGMPSTAGDITYIDYLFLGDYVDRGAHSLETICLLLALKIEYPRSIHLLRGNHEAADINALFGFRMECMERMGEYGVFIWQRINQVFNWLPLAAHVENKILCMHGGIGRSINRIKQIEVLYRPLTMEQGGVVLMDLLWSDPTTNDGVQVRLSTLASSADTMGQLLLLPACPVSVCQCTSVRDNTGSHHTSHRIVLGCHASAVFKARELSRARHAGSAAVTAGPWPRHLWSRSC
jgi:protein phosphatase